MTFWELKIGVFSVAWCNALAVLREVRRQLRDVPIEEILQAGDSRSWLGGVELSGDDMAQNQRFSRVLEVC